MKLFYGVQATGNGHITRARAIAPKLRKAGVEVTYLFTGRPREKLFEMEVFGDYLWRPGLTFATRAGDVKYLRTALRNNIPTFLRDLRELDLRGYDRVVVDFEPVTAWAAKLRGIETVGIGHQYAFDYPIPKTGADFMGTRVLRYFAPVSLGLGVHWHPFGNPILPPIIETDVPTVPVQPDKIIVYLPFEDIHRVGELLRPFSRHRFQVYSPSIPSPDYRPPEHVEILTLSRKSFQTDFADAAGVVTNAGFELTSEALHLGKKLLVKPLHRQMEQLSNAKAMEVLKLGWVMQDLDGARMAAWLESGRTVQVRFPDVAAAVAEWLVRDGLRLDPGWIAGIWDQVSRQEA